MSAQHLLRRGDGLYAKSMSNLPVCECFSGTARQVSDIFQITESCWLRATQNNPSFIPSLLLSFECVSSFKNALKRRLRSRHTKRMRWFILINLIFYSGQEGLVTSSNLEISSCNSCLQLIYKNIKQGHLQHGVLQELSHRLPPSLPGFRPFVTNHKSTLI